MRVYFNGSFSNGKTTLKNWVASRYSLASIPEMARTVLAEKEITDLSALRSNTELLLDVQIEIIKRQYEAELTQKDEYVCCRGLDSAAFLVNFAEDEDVQKFVNSTLYKKYVKWLKQSDAITFLVTPHRSLIKDDGLRDTDWELSLQLFSCAKTLLRYEGITYHPISDINPSERISTIKGVIDGHK